MNKSCKKIIFILILSACMILKIHADNLHGLESKMIDATINNIDVPTYEYDVYWENMNFIYSISEDYEYNDTTNKYDKVLNGNWSSNSNSMEITNKGNYTINVEIDYNSNVDSVTGSFDITTFKLSKNENKKVYLDLVGPIDETYVEYTKIGNIVMRVW